MIDEIELSAAIDDFCSALSDDFATADILAELARSTLAVLKVDGAGVMVAGEGTLTRLAYATSEPVAELERMEDIVQSGPCRDCFRTGEVINIADLAVEGSWPDFQRAAVELGLRGITTIPLRARGRTWGVLDVYRATPRLLDGRELRATQTLARLALSYLMVAEDRDAARQAQQQLAHVAMHDPLTGLPVRWVFLEHLARALAALERRPDRVAVLFLDLDGLKYVNDTLGHAAGDDVLVEATPRMRAAGGPEG